MKISGEGVLKHFLLFFHSKPFLALCYRAALQAQSNAWAEEPGGQADSMEISLKASFQHHHVNMHTNQTITEQ